MRVSGKKEGKEGGREGGGKHSREAPAIAVEHGHDVEEDGVLRHPRTPADDVCQAVQVGAAVVRDHPLRVVERGRERERERRAV